MKIFAAFFIFALILPQRSVSAALSARLPYDARSAALGGAVGALANGLDGFQANPAAIAALSSLEIRASNLQWLEDSWLRTVSVGFAPVPQLFAVGVQALRFGSGAIMRVAETAQGYAVPLDSSFEASEDLLRLGMAFALQGEKRGLELGLAVLAYQRDYYLVKDGQLALDFGLRYGQAEKGFRAAASILNLGEAIGKDPLPGLLRLESRIQWGDKPLRSLSVSGLIQIPLLQSDSPEAGLGIEVPISRFMFARVGHRFLNQLASWSTGIGLSGGPAWLNLVADFAWLPMDSFGGRQVWSLGLKF